MALTALQTAFIEAFLIHKSAARAAKEAGCECGESGRYDQAGYEFLRNPEVRAELDRRRAHLSELAGATAERTILEMRRMAYWDPAELAEFVIEGPQDIAGLPEHIRRAIVGWGYDKHGNFTLKLADKSRAIEQLARHLNLFKDAPPPVNVNISLDAETPRARLRSRLDGMRKG